MIGNIYYLIGVLVVLSTVSSILKFGKLYSLKEWKEKYEKIIGRKPSKRDFRSKKEYSLKTIDECHQKLYTCLSKDIHPTTPHNKLQLLRQRQLQR